MDPAAPGDRANDGSRYPEESQREWVDGQQPPPIDSHPEGGWQQQLPGAGDPQQGWQQPSPDYGYSQQEWHQQQPPAGYPQQGWLQQTASYPQQTASYPQQLSPGTGYPQQAWVNGQWVSQSLVQQQPPQPQIFVNGQWITPPPPGMPPHPSMLNRVDAMGKATWILLAVSSALAVVMVVADYGWLRLLRRVNDSTAFVTDAEIEQAAQFSDTTAIIWLAAYLATGVMFVSWFYRIRKNAGLWAPTEQRRSQGWSIWGWICPVVNFWFPFQIASDGFRSARPIGSDDRATPPIIGIWWAAWVAGLVLSLMIRTAYREPDGIDDFITASHIDIAYDIVIVAAGVLAIFVVRLITAAQERKIQESVRPQFG